MIGALRRPGSRRFLRIISSLIIPMLAACPAMFGVVPNQAVPDFKAPDLQGNSRSLEDFSSTATVLLFWRPEAERARGAVCAAADAVAANYEGARLVTIVSGEHEKTEIERVVQQCGRPVMVLLDQDRAIFAAYQVVALPTIMILGKDHVVKYKEAGFSHKGIADLTAQLDDIYGRKRIAAAVPEGSPDAIRRHGMALQLLKMGLTGQATEVLKQLVKDHPEYRQAWVSLGYSEIASGKVDESRECLERAFNLDPKNTDVAAGLAWAWWKKGDGAQAAKWAAMVNERDPNFKLVGEASQK
jgi:tetratricopeptide (TPR) repeat protein